MPLFEYKCSDCESKFEILHKSSNNPEKVECPECHSPKVKKLLSTFSAAGFSKSGSDFSPPGESCESGSCGCSSGYCGLN
jgi:putative FmdB family regulatory protein